MTISYSDWQTHQKLTAHTELS